MCKTKRCFKCGEVKPLSEFYKHSKMADGYLNKCKECTKKDVKSRRDEQPEKDLETRLRACRKNPTHKNANMAVDAAVRCGKLEKPNRCQGCGRSSEETRLGSHHYDYTKPLDVIWLCAACHRKVDHVRAYVESGRSWDEYKANKNRALSKVKRAIDFYARNTKPRNEFDKTWIISTLGW